MTTIGKLAEKFDTVKANAVRLRADAIRIEEQARKAEIEADNLAAEIVKGLNGSAPAVHTLAPVGTAATILKQTHEKMIEAPPARGGRKPNPVVVKRRAQLLRVLLAGGRNTVLGLSARTKIPRKDVDNDINKMVARGQVKRAGQGLFEVVTK